MTNNHKLMPCPFCGGNAAIYYDSGTEVWNKSWSVGCKLCGVLFKETGSNSWNSDKKRDATAEIMAVDRWNRRAVI